MNGDIDLLRLRAQCLLAMGDVENAVKHLQQAMRSDPDNTKVRSQYRLVRDIQEKKTAGDEAFKANKLNDAVAHWTECIDLVKESSPSFVAKVYLNRGTASAKLKQHESAIKDCTKAIYYNSEYLKAYIKRADSNIALGGPERITKAIADIEKAIELENDEDNLRELQQKKKKVKVERPYLKALVLYTDDFICFINRRKLP